MEVNFSDDEISKIDASNHKQLISDIHSISNHHVKGKKGRTESGYEQLRDVVDSSTTTRQVFHHEFARLSIVKKSKPVKRALRQSKSKVKITAKSEERKALKKLAALSANKEVSFWEPYVQAQRTAESLHFTDGEDKISFFNEQLGDALIGTTNVPCTKLQREIAKLAISKQANITQDKEDISTQPRLIHAEDAEQIAKMNNDIRKMRVIVAREVQKNRRIKKAKGRHFRRLHRKQKEKLEVRVLSNTGESAKLDGDESNAQRSQERITLKHKSKNRKIARLLKYAKHNPVVRQILNDRLDKSNKLKRKQETNDDQLNSEDEHEAEISAIKAYDVLKRLEKRNALAVQSRRQHMGFSELENIKFDQSSWIKPSAEQIRQQHNHQTNSSSVQQFDILETIGDSNMDVDMSTIIEDNSEEFKSKKKQIETSNKIKDTPGLPGWNCWSGGLLGTRTAQKSRFKARKPVNNKILRNSSVPANVIINPNAVNSSLQKHQVKKIPFPFKSILDYEDSLKQPLGREWNPETVFRNFNKPQIVTIPGKIIEPIQKQDV
ncbi:hypothetical protein GJ496_002924 [Pomphorhynchus laevis]|nr:hypothetical protein GJ496_002924 [Pomphorhynchus laevis]